MSIAESLVGIVRETLEREVPGGRVEAVDLRVGRLRAVIPENLRFCFEVICGGTELEGAVLRIEEVPVRVRCAECGVSMEKDAPVFLCDACGSPRLDLLSGKELEIRSIDVND
jgi:hydrogenase nickel incorporation protein HypA/HybF